MADQYGESWLRWLWAAAGLFIVLSVGFVLYFPNLIDRGTAGVITEVD
jgi:hypothetical protein